MHIAFVYGRISNCMYERSENHKKESDQPEKKTKNIMSPLGALIFEETF